MMKQFIFILMLTVGIATATQSWASELFGKIVYKGAPLQNAEVTVTGQKIKTNAIGYYSVNLEPGTYALEIKLPDGSTRKESVDVFPQDTEKNLKLD